MGNFILILSTTIFIITASWYLIEHMARKLKNHPPSPFSLPILGHLHLLRDPLHETLSKITHKVGPVSLLYFGHRRVLHVASPQAAEDCLHRNDILFANRPRLLTGDIFGYNSKTLIWAHGNLWRDLRRISTVQILSPQSLHLSSGIRSSEVRSLIRRLASQSGGDDQRVEIGSALFDMSHNVMMKVLVKQRYEREKARMFREKMEEVMRVEGTTTIVDVFPWLGFFGFRKRLRERFMGLAEEKEKFLDDLLERHRRNMEGEEVGSGNSSATLEKMTLVEVLLGLQEDEPQVYTDDMIKGLFQVLLLAGTDTTAGTTEWALALLLNNPEILKKAQQEIDSQIGRNRLLEEADLNNLPYLHSIIKETLRLYPAGPLLIPHESSEKCVVEGYTIPRGTMLFVNVWAIQNDSKYWQEPEEFRPERFAGVDESGEQMKCKFMPFGLGRRACPGEGMAIKLVGLALGSLLQCFDWARPSQELIDMAQKNGISMPKAKPLQAKCQTREPMAKLMSQT